jgi:hypothetical protein
MYVYAIVFSLSLCCFVMAPKLQACLTKFLYDMKVNGDGNGEGS